MVLKDLPCGFHCFECSLCTYFIGIDFFDLPTSGANYLDDEAFLVNFGSHSELVAQVVFRFEAKSVL